jgi:hypothetical protein
MDETPILQAYDLEQESLKVVGANLIAQFESTGELVGGINFAGLLNRSVGDINAFYPLFWTESNQLVAYVENEIFIFGTNVTGSNPDLVINDPHGSPVHLGRYLSVIEHNEESRLVITPTEYTLSASCTSEVYSAIVLNAQHHILKKKSAMEWGLNSVVMANATIYNNIPSAMADINDFFVGLIKDESLSYALYLLKMLKNNTYCPELRSNV